MGKIVYLLNIKGFDIMIIFDINIGFKKLLFLCVIFILNVLKIFFVFGLLIGFKYFDFEVGFVSGLSVVIMIFWMMIGYIVMFVVIVVLIFKCLIIGFCVVIVVDFLIFIFVKVFVGFVIVLIGLGFSFIKLVKGYFVWCFE